MPQAPQAVSRTLPEPKPIEATEYMKNICRFAHSTALELSTRVNPVDQSANSTGGAGRAETYSIRTVPEPNQIEATEYMEKRLQVYTSCNTSSRA
jgi:hypothetical protein